MVSGNLSPELFGIALDSLSAHVVILDEHGVIIYVNDAWKEFARRNGYSGSTFWVGTPYLAVCPVEDPGANSVHAQFEWLLRDQKGEFRRDYPCHSPREKRWFQMRARGFVSSGKFYIAVVHENVTEIKLAEEKLGRSLDELSDVHSRLKDALLQSIGALGRALEKRDPYTAGHQQQVVELSLRIAREIGLSVDQIQGLRLGALVHDIGKLSIPVEILSVPRKLTAIERQLIETHPRAGYEILKDTSFPWPLAEMVFQHHESLDGSGYPRGLRGDEILMEARIISVADVADAIISHHPYRAGLGREFAIKILREGRSTAFDPRIVDACIEILLSSD